MKDLLRDRNFRTALARVMWELLARQNGQDSPIPGVRIIEKLTFEVDSRSEAIPRRVDLSEHNLMGVCNCPNFQTRPPTERATYQCWHIKRAQKWLMWAVLPILAELFQETHKEKETW